jgi:hypothetical protein
VMRLVPVLKEEKNGASRGALEWTRTTTPLQAQALNLLRIPFRHEGMLFVTGYGAILY